MEQEGLHEHGRVRVSSEVGDRVLREPNECIPRPGKSRGHGVCSTCVKLMGFEDRKTWVTVPSSLTTTHMTRVKLLSCLSCSLLT